MTALSERTGLNFNKHEITHSEKSGMNERSVRVGKRVGKLTLLKSEFHSFRVKFHSVRVRMDEVSLEKSK